jgi:uncharacterized repeat protein (TIGR01451 family)
MKLRSSGFRRALGVALFLAVAGAIAATSAIGGSEAQRGDDTPAQRAALTPLAKGENDQEGRRVLLERDAYFTSLRTAGDNQLAPEQAGRFRAVAADKALKQRKGPKAPGTNAPPNPAWSQLGPNPIVQQVRTSGGLSAMSGRIGDTLILDDGTRLIGGAQGGIWMWNTGTNMWEPKSDDAPSLAIGALAAAPSNNDIVYAGTGEGHLSGDSMYGNGVLKSTDGGNTWTHVSGDFFEGVSISQIVVNPTDPNNLYASVLRGRGGARRVTPAEHSRYGIWHSTDGGVNWTLLKEVSESNGATDLEMDPQDPQTLWASFWSDTLYKSTDGGNTWNPVDFGLNSPDFAGAATRISVAVSHPIGVTDPVLYAGFEWVDATGYHAARIFKSTDGGDTWTKTPSGNDSTTDHSEDYCGTQCFYDNVVQASPVNPDIVFIGGNFNYGAGSGGIYKTIDGGTHWLDMGYDQHPDIQALAFNPTDPTQVLYGSDGGVWFSPDLGGRDAESDPLSDADWQNLNGTVTPGGTVLARTGLAITQYTSIAPAIGVPAGASSERYWGGTQDNGTLRKSVNSNTWFDEAGGDGGQVLVDPSEAGQPCEVVGAGACHVYGEYFGISPYRFSDGGAILFNAFFITNGLNLNDRSEFYVPMTLNENNTDQLFLGTFRIYRTDNARADDPADVHWNMISDDLTGGCTGTAPNGARTCAISAIGTGGGSAVYVGTLDGRLWVATDGQTSMTPNWKRQDNKQGNKLPNRPISWFAVDRSNYRNAWVAYNGFNAATPSRPGHVFRTTDAGAHWKDASGNLPDVPVNSLDQDPSYPLTLYAATDVGPYVTQDGGKTWSPLGTGFPLVTTWQLKMDTTRRILVAGTHGRGAFRAALGDSVPSLVVSKIDDGTPVGGGSELHYSLTVRNIGNADATGVTITDPLPANTQFVSADHGGTFDKKKKTVKWTGLTVPAGDSITVHFTVKLKAKKNNKATQDIVNDGIVVTSAQGPGATGSPFITKIAPAYGVDVTPATQRDGAHTGDSADYHVVIRNIGFTASAFNVSSSGGTFPSQVLDGACGAPMSTTPVVAPGATTNACVRVNVPGGANENDSSTSTFTAAAVPSPSASDTATVTTLAVSKDWLLVDDDNKAPDVESYYTAALAGAGVSDYGTWDIAADTALPPGYIAAHKYVVWFTGNSYPAPITKYEDGLQALLDGGGHLFMSGQDILDQGAGTTDFVHDYLHITWDGTETQNDKATATVTGVTGDPIGNGLGTKPLDHSVLGAAFEDRITPNGTASAAFQDDTAQTDGLSYTDGTGYQVVFLAFPLEAYGSAADKSALMSKVVTFFTT